MTQATRNPKPPQRTCTVAAVEGEWWLLQLTIQPEQPPVRRFRSSADIARNAPEEVPGYFDDDAEELHCYDPAEEDISWHDQGWDLPDDLPPAA